MQVVAMGTGRMPSPRHRSHHSESSGQLFLPACSNSRLQDRSNFGAFPRTIHLEDRSGQGRVANEGLVGSIKEDEGFVGTGIIHPAQSSGTPTNPVVTATVTATGITATHSWDPYSTYPDGCFNVQYRDNIDSSSTWVQANADCSQGNNYTVTDLSRNVFYAFRIQRVNQADQRIIST